MNFNRYIALRAIVEFVGAVACATQLFQHRTWPGIIMMSLIALFWAIGELWLTMVYNRAHPRRDELSDEHQATAIRFTFFILVAALVVLGFIGVKLIMEALHGNSLPFLNGGQPISWVPEVPTWLSLVVIVLAIGGAALASVIKMRTMKANEK